MNTVSTVNGGIPFWYAHGGTPVPREPLAGDTSADVCVVGGGYTGLWTAYYLKRAVPFLDITVLEAAFCGHGASGRNGGRLHNGFAGRGRYARLHGHDAAVRLQQAVNATVAEVVRFAADEKIDADIHHGGTLEVARNPAQLARLRDHHSVEIAFGENDRVMRGARETAERVRIAGAVGSTWTPHGARLHPAKLVTGLADAVEALGVTVHESTPVTEIRPKHAVTPYGTVRAPYVLRCTEGYTAALKGHGRTWLPMDSSVIVTEPLPSSLWDTLGWQGRETLGDLAHSPVYAQRTADGRIVLGRRDASYRHGPAVGADTATRTPPATVDALRDLLVRLFPTTAGTRIDHTWSGLVGVPRDRCATVALDRSTGLGWAGGYADCGVATANLAARTLRDLIQQDSGQAGPTELTTLPWVGHTSRRWEPEPLRRLGVHTVRAAYRAADRREAAAVSAETDRLATWADRLTGRA